MHSRMDSVISSSTAFAAGLVDDWCLSKLSTFLQGAPVRLELWNKGCTNPVVPPVATVVIKDRGTLIGLLRRPALTFGEAYSAGRIVVKGDLVRLLEVVNRALAGRSTESAVRRAPADAASARENVHVHYDLGNAFYRLWLDEAMVYTCAYFDDPDVTLEEAQRAKMDYVCRKLRLQPGDHVIEAGCGWGALALFMAKQYGVTVRAFNISDEQLRDARERAAREGLSDRVTFVNGDYRTIEGRCDAFVSIGMLEHVGPADYAALGAIIDRVLDPNHGRGLLHFIGRNAPMEFNPWIARHIFPGAYAPALSEVLPRMLEPANLSVLDIENLRPHYALTLKHWLERFESHAESIRAMFDDPFVRMWRLYLASAQAGFASGDLQLFQVTFGRASDTADPWTRRALYERPTNGPM